jgi:uncharacterized protein (DUF302 family)
MTYYINCEIDKPFDDAVALVKKALAEQGFGILTEIDVKATLKKKLDVNFQNYVILGACNPQFAYKALLAEDKIGTMLPCNVIVQEKPDGKIEVAAIDPLASMQAVQNALLQPIGEDVREKFRIVIQNLKDSV